MDLRRFVEIVNRRAFLTFVTAACTVGVAGAAWTYLPATYEAKAILHIVTPTVASDWLQYDFELTDRLMSLYATLAEGQRAEDAVADALSRTEAPYIAVEPIPNSSLLEVVARTDTAVAAATAANVLASTLIELGMEMGLAAPEGGQLHRLSVMEAAVPPTEPSGPSLPLLLLVALVAGTALGILLAFVAENLDRRLYFVEDISVITGLPSLTVVPRGRGSRQRRIAPNGSAQGQAYRRLRAQLLARGVQHNPTVLVVVSGQSGAGVSTVVGNLASVVAAIGKTVLIVDCSRSIAAHRSWLRDPDAADKSSRPVKQSPQAETIQATQIDGVKFMSTPATKVADLLPELVQQFNIVIVDAGSLVESPAALSLAHMGVGFVLVVRRCSTHAEVLADTRDQLRSFNAYVLGTVTTNARTGEYSADLAADSWNRGEPASGQPTTVAEGEIT